MPFLSAPLFEEKGESAPVEQSLNLIKEEQLLNFKNKYSKLFAKRQLWGYSEVLFMQSLWKIVNLLLWSQFHHDKMKYKDLFMNQK